MDRVKISREELMELANGMIRLRSNMSTDHLHIIFFEVPIIDYNLILQLWPVLEHNLDAECEPVYLQEISEGMNRPMNQVSKLVQVLNERGMIRWERGESGTYVLLSDYGREKMKKQQGILLNYFAQVITEIGEERFKNLIQTLNEVEQVMENAIESNPDLSC